VIPSNPADAKGLLLAAIRDDDPVIFCEAKGVLMQRGEVPEGDYTIPIGQAKVVRAGGDVTLVAFGATLAVALAAAEQLAREGTEPRECSPLAKPTRSGNPGRSKTGRLVVADESDAARWDRERRRTLRRSRRLPERP
jgi:pyruvate dehydrogenase E1 component beta subunit